MTQRQQNAYDRALAQFEALVLAPSKLIIRNPAGLSKQAGLSSSTGHRLSNIAEAQGVLQREPTGTYRSGPLLLRAGLSALGFGQFAYAAAPLLVDLRQRSGLTAFLYILRSTTLLIGPYSIGRSSDFVRPSADYIVEAENIEKPTLNVIKQVECIEPFDIRRQALLIQHGSIQGNTACGLGLILPRHADVAIDTVSTTLSLVVERFAAADKDKSHDV